jgi:hypothetical protein
VESPVGRRRPVVILLNGSALDQGLIEVVSARLGDPKTG